MTSKPKEIRMGKGAMGYKKAKMILLSAAKKLAVPCALIAQKKKI